MKLKVYSVYDSAVESFSDPFYAKSQGEARRSWMEASSDPKLPFHRHPGDYTLFEIADFDQDTGTFIPHDAKVSLGTALQNQSPSSKAPQTAPGLGRSIGMDKNDSLIERSN